MPHNGVMAPAAGRHAPCARLGGLVASGLDAVTSELSALDTTGRWAVLLPFAGRPVLARFDRWAPGPPEDVAGAWEGPIAWSSSMGRQAYVDAVEVVREHIAAGDVYQANVCRVMRADLPDAARSDIGGLHALLDRGNPAPFSGMLRLPDHGIHVATASPELFLRSVPSTSGGDEGYLESGPIKGTGRTPQDLTEKDRAENVMIVDLVRNDLSRVSVPGTVSVPDLLALEEHPGLVHLVSRVRGRLTPAATWPEIMAATFPPGSVTGAPKIAALGIIDEVEPVSREVYCGAIGWVDADRGTAELAVSIRTFWHDGETLKFGTGAGITWGSDAQREWEETELKAARLIALASGCWPSADDPPTTGASTLEPSLARVGSAETRSPA